MSEVAGAASAAPFTPVLTGRCKSCDAAIFYATTKKGKNMPIDLAPSAAGTLSVFQANGKQFCEVMEGGAFTSHFATCPKASKWRKR